jgi:hypothetical protein
MEGFLDGLQGKIYKIKQQMKGSIYDDSLRKTNDHILRL